MSAIQESDWGSFHTRPVHLYTLTNAAGTVACVTDYGAILQSFSIPDASGRLVDVALGFETLEGYLGTHPFFGATAGRCANRIAGGRFTLDGKPYALAVNSEPNHIHGGYRGFDKRLWDVARAGQGLGDVFVKFVYHSADGEEGYPGALDVAVTYTLTHDNRLRIEMQAKTDAPTLVNLANHSYWNLNGHDSGSILDHVAILYADQYTPTDATRIPTGELRPVTNTPFDFTSQKPIGRDMAALPKLSDEDPGGYDHNFLVQNADGTLQPAARVCSLQSGLTLTVHTNQPGVQFYTGNFLKGSVTGKKNVSYVKHGGFCLETQKYPDAINKQGRPDWPSVILRPGESYYHEVQYAFSLA